jgi:hypothetical protein
MTKRDVLRDELARFSTWLVGAEVAAALGSSDTTVSSYLRWHLRPEARGDRFDHALLRIAAFGRPGLALADAYAARFRRTALLRRKLSLVIALIETGPSHEALEATISSSAAGFYLRLIARGIVALGVGGLAVLVIGPIHIVCQLAPAADEAAA